MFPPRIDLRTLRVLSTCDNHYTTETNTVMFSRKYDQFGIRFLSKDFDEKFCASFTTYIIPLRIPPSQHQHFNVQANLFKVFLP